MSNYYRLTKHPITGKWGTAEWVDNYFGHHMYGVKFKDGCVFNPYQEKVETKDDIMKKKIKSNNGLYAVVEDGELVFVEHKESGNDNFFSDSQEWLYELYKILKRCDEIGCFKGCRDKEEDDYEVELV